MERRSPEAHRQDYRKHASQAPNQRACGERGEGRIGRQNGSPKDVETQRRRIESRSIGRKDGPCAAPTARGSSSGSRSDPSSSSRPDRTLGAPRKGCEGRTATRGASGRAGARGSRRGAASPAAGVTAGRGTTRGSRGDRRGDSRLEHTRTAHGGVTARERFEETVWGCDSGRTFVVHSHVAVHLLLLAPVEVCVCTRCSPRG